MKEKSTLIITLTALSMFGFRSILPEISSFAVAKFNTIYVALAHSKIVASVVDSVMLFLS